MERKDVAITSKPVNPKQGRLSLWVMVLVSSIASSLVTAGIAIGVFSTGVFDSRSMDTQRQVVVQEGELIADVASQLSPSVVSIRTAQRVTTFSDIFGQQSRLAQGAGTGIILNKEGLVLTNKHVIPEGISNLTITLSDGTEYDDAKVVGRDPLNDLAFIQIQNPKNLIPAKLGDSDSVRTGTKVIAIGNALGEFDNTVTSGIISGIGRPIEASNGDGTTEQLSNLFQTDAAINPGNSGGPLINFNGEVIGVNTAVAADAQGVGFAIPINEAKPLIASVEKSGEVQRPYLGVRYVMLTPALANELNIKQTEGAYISDEPESVINNSPADKAGLQPEDVITKVNEQAVNDRLPLASALSRYGIGEAVQLTIFRDGKEQTVRVTLEAAPSR
jgi:serine protease Do